MTFVTVGNKNYDVDYILCSNDTTPIFFKYNSSKRVKKELKSMFETHSFVVLEKRLNKYGLKSELVFKTSGFSYYNIVCINSWGGYREHKKPFTLGDDL